MAKLTITIEMDNAAFGDGNDYERGAEVSRILRDRADSFKTNGVSGDGDINLGGYLRDYNGNTVGTWQVTG